MTIALYYFTNELPRTYKRNLVCKLGTDWWLVADLTQTDFIAINLERLERLSFISHVCISGDSPWYDRKALKKEFSTPTNLH